MLAERQRIEFITYKVWFYYMNLKSILYIFYLLVIIILIKMCFIIIDIQFMPISDDYDRAMYSVVIHNTTNTVINDVKVYYGSDHPDHYTLQEFTQLNQINPGQYVKVNIPTKEFPMPPPYNVYLKYQQDELLCVGYTGLKTGGFETVEIVEMSGKNELKLLMTTDKKYKKILRRHHKNQMESEWY